MCEHGGLLLPYRAELTCESWVMVFGRQGGVLRCAELQAPLVSGIPQCKNVPCHRNVCDCAR